MVIKKKEKSGLCGRQEWSHKKVQQRVSGSSDVSTDSSTPLCRVLNGDSPCTYNGLSDRLLRVYKIHSTFDNLICIMACKDSDRRAGWATVNDSITGRFDFHRKPSFRYLVITVLEVFACYIQSTLPNHVLCKGSGSP
jgi:hypothetical protein